MASIEEIVNQLSGSADQLGQTMTRLGAAENTAGQLQQQMAAMGVQDKAAQFAHVREAIDRARQHLAGGNKLIDEAINAAKAAGGG